jgi:uncharacterized protein YecT (DUF1311 family)
MRTIVVLGAALIASTAALAGAALYPKQDCSKAVTQMDLDQCAGANDTAADAALNAFYKKLMAQASDAKAADALKESERAWIAYRDRECDREVGPREESGSIWPMEMSLCLEDKTASRLCELRRSNDLSQPPAPACPK